MSLITGEKKLGKVITPDTWKDGARNTTGELNTIIKGNVRCFEDDHIFWEFGIVKPRHKIIQIYNKWVRGPIHIRNTLN